jgi:hypothetical protein
MSRADHEALVEAVAGAMRSPHCVKWPEKVTKENPNVPQVWSVIETAKPFSIVCGPFMSEREANDAIVKFRCSLAIDLVRKMLETATPEMQSAAAGALKIHIEALPAETRAKTKEAGGQILVGPLEKHAVRWRAMLRASPLSPGKDGT